VRMTTDAGDGTWERRVSRAWLVSALAVAVLAGCAGQAAVTTTPRPSRGAGTSTMAGADTGVLIDKDNRWRGAAHGAALGGVLTGSVAEISLRAARESVAANRPVTYHSTDGWQRVEAAPGTSGGQGCPQVHERVYQDNQLVREQIREVC
jgi:hypothetical protein